MFIERMDNITQAEKRLREIKRWKVDRALQAFTSEGLDVQGVGFGCLSTHDFDNAKSALCLFGTRDDGNEVRYELEDEIQARQRRRTLLLSPLPLVIVVKYRRKALYDEVIRETPQEYHLGNVRALGIEILAQEPAEDHMHILFKCAPTTELTKGCQHIKGASSRRIRQEFPQTKNIFGVILFGLIATSSPQHRTG